MPVKTWSDAATEKLRELWAKGWSCSQIASAIGGGISRNAVIGKATRLKLTGRMSGGKKGMSGRKPGYASQKNDRKHIRNRIISAKLRREAQEAALLEAKKAQSGSETDIARKTLMELEPGDCRYIPGIPTGRCFCALPVFPGTSYCPTHFAVTRQQRPDPKPAEKPSLNRETSGVMA